MNTARYLPECRPLHLFKPAVKQNGVMFDSPETPSVDFGNLEKSSNTFTAILYAVATLSLYQVLKISSPALNNFSLSQVIYSTTGLSLTIAGVISILTVFTVYTRTETHFQELNKQENLLANLIVVSTLLTALIPAFRQAISQNPVIAVSASIAQIGIYHHLNKRGDQ